MTNTKLVVANGAFKTIAKEEAHATSKKKEKTSAFMEVRRFARMVAG